MKILQSSVFRAICAIVVGGMLIKNPDSTVKGITIAIGVLFLISGVISCVVYFNARMHSADNEVYDSNGRLLVGGRPAFPIVGLGSVILGFILALMPGAFVTSLMYVLSGILLLGALNQFLVLIQARKFARLPMWYWVCPSLILLTGIFVMVKPMESAGLPLLIIGWCLLFLACQSVSVRSRYINTVVCCRKATRQVTVKKNKPESVIRACLDFVF